MSAVITRETSISWVSLDKQLPPLGKKVLVRRLVAGQNNVNRCEKVFYARFHGEIPASGGRLIELWSTPTRNDQPATHWLRVND